MTDPREQDRNPEERPGKAGQTQPSTRNPAAAQPGEGSEPRSGERLTHHTSQGLAGAQGSGGGAERGIQQDPGPGRPMAQRDDGPPSAPPAGGDATPEGDAGR